MGAEKKAWLGPGQENGDQAWLKVCPSVAISPATPLSVRLPPAY